MREGAKVLILVEGEKTEVKIVKELFKAFNIDTKYEIVSYCTDIYTLHNSIFANGEEDAEMLDLLQVLKSKEQDASEKLKLHHKYTDIYLFFDFDPHADGYTSENILRMQRYFNESTDNGKLYINYPMVESFYHFNEEDYDTFFNKMASIEEVKNKQYKSRVNKECYCNYSKYYDNLEKLSRVVLYNALKSHNLQYFGEANYRCKNIEEIEIDFYRILENQLALLSKQRRISILCTCCLIIWEFNPSLVLSNLPGYFK